MTQIGKLMNTRANVTFTNTTGNINSNKTETKGTTKATNVSANWFEKNIERKDLDIINAYAGMGLELSTKKAPVGSVDSYKDAAPEFGKWQGNFTIEDTQSALNYLTEYNNTLKHSV